MRNQDHSCQRKKTRIVANKRAKSRKHLRRKRTKMATNEEIENHLNKALKEIGEIKPWFDEEVSEWVFSHPLYPVEYGGESKQETKENYPLYLRDFIEERLNNNLDPFIENQTKGHGGKRAGAGRPKGSIKPSVTIRLDPDIAGWVRKHTDDIRSVMDGELALVACKN